MERDFLSLAVKQEPSEETTDAAPVRSSPMQWPFANRGSSLLSFHGVQDEKPKTGFDSFASTRSVTLKNTEAFDSAQINIVSETQGGVRYTMTTYPTKHLDSYAIHRPMANQTNRTISPPVTTSMHHSIIANSRQNLIGSISSHPQAGVAMTNPVSAVPSNSPVVGTTDLRNASSIPEAAAQLTIFYNGSVCVYDNVAPEKAQAIMLLAGNGPPMTSNATPPPPPVQASTPRPNVLDGFVVSQSYSTTPHRLSPAPVNSISVSPSIGRANNEANVAKPAGVLLSSSNIAQPLKVVSSLGSAPLSADAVPQFRKKSLARFLEKRKERATTANPYADKQSQDCSNPGVGDGKSLSMNSSGSCPAPPNK